MTEKGLLEILSLKSSLNLGLSETLKQAFPNIIKIKRPVYKFTDIPNPFWVAGFISGDGSFNISIRSRLRKNQVKKPGLVSEAVTLNLEICLHVRDEEVIKGLFYYFKSLGENLFGEAVASKNSLKPYYPIYKTEKL